MLPGCNGSIISSDSSNAENGVFQYQNPIRNGIIGGMRDCQIFEDHGKYYLIGTSPPFFGYRTAKALRHNSGHHGSHPFITYEFVEACLNERRPTVDIYEALAYTVPGIIAHESALKGGITMKIPPFD